MLRRSLLSALAIVTLAGGAAAWLSAPASAAGHPAAHASLRGPAIRPAVHLTGAALAAAADQCAAWATDAGFTNNGYAAGSLTTAVAVALAESGCNTAACHDNTTGLSCTQKTETPGDSIDRGPWQLNNKTPDAVADACAYQGPCAAQDAYVHVSTLGTYFARWVQYSQGTYASQLWYAQQAVNALRQGTVGSSVNGSCLAYPLDRRGAKARTANCGTAAPKIWKLAGSTLRTSGGLCLTATSSSHTAAVELARCTRSSLESWQTRGGGQLYNAGARRCLSDQTPLSAGGSLPGVVLDTASCAGTQGDGWFLP
jgi:Lysozyme like domain/Ricin-type beta-trefoil lectin domain